MAIIEYINPTSWNDKGMDWGAPDPGNIDYIMAIKLALAERLYFFPFHHTHFNLVEISPYYLISPKFIEQILKVIRLLAPLFVDTENSDKSDLENYPTFYTFSSLTANKNCRIQEYPSVGAPLFCYVDWLKAAKNVLNKLTVTQNINCKLRTLCRDATPFGEKTFKESVDKAMADAMNNLNDTSVNLSGWNYPSAYSSSFIFNMYKDYKFRCQVHASEIVETLSSNPYPFECNLIIDYFIGEPYRGLSSPWVKSIFDLGDSGLSKGHFTKVVPWTNKGKSKISLGNVNSIPKNTIDPEPLDVDIKRGFEGFFRGVADFGINNGFKFR